MSAWPKADTVLTGGRVWRGLGLAETAAIGLWKGRVLAAGGDSDLAGLVGPETRRIDLRGRLAVPGFCDAHEHLIPIGLGLVELDFKPPKATTIAQIVEAVKAEAKRVGPGQWIVGRGYDHFHLDVKRHPLREELDRAAPENPVYIRRTCGHMGVANSATLKAANIPEGVNDPPGGAFERKEGKLTGLVQERAQEIVYRAMPKPNRAHLIDAIERASNHCLSQGITSVVDAGVGLRAKFQEWFAYQEAKRTGRLRVRSYLSFTGGPDGALADAKEAGLVTGVGDEWMRIGPVKFWADGSAGGRTAAMSEPYRCCGNEKGMLCFEDREMEAMVAEVHEAGYQIAIHAIGDAAIEQAIVAVDKALKKHPKEDARPRIEHCGFVTDRQIGEMKRLGMIPSPQPVFIHEFGDLYVDVLGEERSAASYPMRRWHDRGLRPAAGSDAPVSSDNPLIGLHVLVTRKTDRNRVLGASETLPLAEALHTYTANGAYSAFAEKERGTLEPGMLADIAVLDRDVLEAEPAALLEAKIDLTLVGGEVRYDRMAEF
ncbi:MAG: amidohydrolase [Alphaproteobacteria bacterium]|nr:amidohydrolase [Alphaproteobacteria bacterium]